jgi:hypothetical protein
MASSSDDKEKAPPEDNRQDLQPKEEVESKNRRRCAEAHCSSMDILVRQQLFPYSNT